MTATTGYAPVNGLRMYHEIHGEGRPLLLLHGAFSDITTDFGDLLPLLARGRRVIAVEFQGHGRTADIDRPLTIEQLAADCAELLRHLDVGPVDVFGFSVGAGVALQLGLRHPDLVDRLVLASITYDSAGFHPGLLDGIEQLQPEHLHGSPYHAGYLRLAPRPEDFPTLVAKVKEMDRNLPDVPADEVRGLAAPVLIVVGDSDIVRPEHAVELFRLLGGGVAGDAVGLPRSRLAMLPGTSHVGMMQRADWIAAMVDDFLGVAAPASA
ncbi:pimeloyl-ACP methyl ester carboxylesterase [Micromonospora kangleipakensis]|uniref:Pimeloyl-ACP methyl ester carboxylesterase n=1 Tax=Micromonospora kangleipakensis TaxID=1077942 RepID=A0A4Q8BB81_9ACTN|nr:alpha/beta hydrolase [Micromonospora kangleipakensis]RZU74521.1 pimeloyl-ACP methyl ester carboxylesterase [Micromonospora kangleipakensis]